MRWVTATLCLCGLAGAVDVGTDTSSTFYRAPAGSIQEITAQEFYFSRATQVMLGLQQAYHWSTYGQLEAIKAYKSGLFDSGGGGGMAMEEESGCVAETTSEGTCEEGKTVKLPAVPKNPSLAHYMKENSPRMLEEFHLGGAEPEVLENVCNYARLAALKTMQIQVFTASSVVQKSYWTTKLMQTTAPAQLTYFSVLKSFLSTVSLSLMMQLQDSFTLFTYLDNFNDEMNDGSSDRADLAEDVAGYQTYSSWSSIAGIKMAMLLIDYSEAQTTVQAIQAMQAQTQMMTMSQPQPPSVPTTTMSQTEEPTTQPNVETAQPNVEVTGTVVAEAPYSEEPEGAQSLLEVDLKADSGHKFAPAGGNPLQTYATLQYTASLIKIYNLMVEFQLTQVGLTSQTYKIMDFRIQNDGIDSNDSFGDKLGEHADLLDGLFLPQLYSQWGQITIFLNLMDLYLFQTEMSISAAAGAGAGGIDFSTQMRSVQATNLMESMNF